MQNENVFNRNDGVETQESPAKQAKVAKERREPVLWSASRNGGQNQNPGNPFPFAPFGFFAGQQPFPSAWFRFNGMKARVAFLHFARTRLGCFFCVQFATRFGM